MAFKIVDMDQSCCCGLPEVSLIKELSAACEGLWKEAAYQEQDLIKTDMTDG